MPIGKEQIINDSILDRIIDKQKSIQEKYC